MNQNKPQHNRIQADVAAEGKSDLAWRQASGEDMAAAAIHASGTTEDMTKLPAKPGVTYKHTEEDTVADFNVGLAGEADWKNFADQKPTHTGARGQQ